MQGGIGDFDILGSAMSRIVLHLDMDAFFAAVEERDKPRLKGLPIVVGSDPVNGRGRGVVSTANYAARKYGIKSAMPISKAWDLSQQAKKAGKPEVTFIGGNYHKYSAVSKEIFKYLATKGDAFEPASVDEAYLEFSSKAQATSNKLQVPSNTENEWEAAKKLGQEIKDYIKKNFQLTCSIGIGPNKLIAKIAAGENKPDGLTVIRDEEVQDFLDPKSVRELLGIGPKTEAELKKFGILTIAQLRAKSKDQLIEWFGKHGEGMYRSARGISDSPVEAGWEAKSVGRHQTYDTDTLDGTQLMTTLREMAEEISRDVRKEKKWFRTVTLTVRFSNFITHNRSHTIDPPAQDAKTLETEGMKLLLPFLDSRENPKRLKIRLIGLRAEKFVENKETSAARKVAKQQGLF